MTTLKQRISTLGMLALTAAGAAAVSMPVHGEPVWFALGARLSVVFLVAFLWTAWFRAETREDNA